MASLLIQETLGKDTSSQLYSIEKDFQILRNFTRALLTMDSEEKPEFDWKKLLGISDNEELVKVVNDKAHLGKLMLISVHGAMAKEIIKQNTILQYKLAPVLLNTNTFVSALNQQLEDTPERVSDEVKLVYGDVTYKALSIYSEDIFCKGGENAAMYLQFPADVDNDRLAEVLCNASIAIESGLKNDSIVSKAIDKINNTTHTMLEEVNWTKLISNIQTLYVKIDKDYPYIFEFSTYAMDKVTQENVRKMYENAKEYWFGLRNLQRGLHLSLNLGFRLLDLLDHGIFNMTSETWLKIKFVTTNAVGPLNIKPIISLLNGSPPWPCSTTSISELLELSTSSRDAVRALETLLCMNRDMQEEWMKYLNTRKAKIDKTLAWNTTQYEPHLFLKMSSALNSLIDDTALVKVRRASLTQFWDCDAVVSALAPAADSPIQMADVKRVKPYVCPSFIYWLSLPRDDNVLFNVVAKPQYYFYSFPVQNATSSFESVFSKGVTLANFLTNVAKENKTSVTEELKMDNVKNKLANFIDKILNYRLKETDNSYKVFSDVNKKVFMSNVYLTRVVAIVNKLATGITNLTIDENFIANEKINQDDVAKITADLSIMKNVFKRKAVDAIAIHFDLLTDFLWTDDDNYTLINAMDSMCNDLKANTSKVILVDEVRTKVQICAKNYKVLYGAVLDSVLDDYEDARQSLLSFVKILQNGDESNITDLFEFLNSRTKLVKSLKHSIKYSYDLGLPIYLKYLQSNLQGYRVLLTFLSGGDWWDNLRTLYDGPEATKFFGHLEQGFEVADNFLDNLDGIHLVRLVRDMNINETDSFCRSNITLSDYIPDSTGTLSDLKQQLCMIDKVELHRELPPLLFASQGYESSLRMSKDVDYTSLNTDIFNIESNIGLINNGPKEPLRPTWVTNEKIDQLRKDVLSLLSKESLTKITFGVLSNGVDAGTLFLNNDQCTLCSQMTTWFKQLNLQLFKKQEYDNLLCHLDTMSLEDIYYTLKNDFHWDMFIRELISSRNYTKYELNKSMNEFLGLVEVHLLDDIRAPATKLTECLAHNVSRNEFGNATLFIQVLAHTAKLLRAETPHLHKVEGVKDLPYLKQLYTDVAHNLNVYQPLKEYFKEGSDLKKDLKGVVDDDVLILDVMEADVNLREAIGGADDSEELIRLRTNRWEHICEDHDCGDMYAIIEDNLNKTKIEMDLPAFQSSEYWQFSFVSSILQHIEGILSHAARLSGVASAMDVTGVAQGKLAAMLDAVAKILMDDTVDTSKDRNFHITEFMCEIEAMSQVLSPGDIDVVSAEEVSAATVEQFCSLDEDIAKDMIRVLMGNADFTPVIDKVK
ncbi:putative ATP-binding cassette [Operophtera brumata]|uniref:Putative ATP-binding cassette n=1 Tax=Operophtera brumata TaxID=104452 RepID=A0A0L7LSE6_OPEBR|nr:putative ATP-binding cassette [Operophtera brumata]